MRVILSMINLMEMENMFIKMVNFTQVNGMTVYEKVEEQKFIKIKIKNMMDILKK